MDDARGGVPLAIEEPHLVIFSDPFDAGGVMGFGACEVEGLVQGGGLKVRKPEVVLYWAWVWHWRTIGWGLTKGIDEI